VKLATTTFWEKSSHNKNSRGEKKRRVFEFGEIGEIEKQNGKGVGNIRKSLGNLSGRGGMVRGGGGRADEVVEFIKSEHIAH